VEDNLFIEIGLPIALFIIMVGIGLTLTTGDFRREGRAPRAMVVGTIAQVVLMPALGFLIAWLLDLSPAIAVGLVIAAACPGGTSSNLIAFLGRANVALSIILTVVVSVVTIVTLPIAGNLALAWQPTALDVAVRVPVARTIALLVGIVLVPVAIGMSIRRRDPARAVRLEKAVNAFGGFVLVLLIAAIVWTVRHEFWDLLAQSGPAAILLNLGGIAVGIGVGVLAGLSRTDQLTCAMELGVKNATLGMLIALTILGSATVAMPSAVYGFLMYFSAIGLVIYGRRIAATRAHIKADEVTEPT
jgi:bile acid:Na+ symporter, BASS family